MELMQILIPVATFLVVVGIGGVIAASLQRKKAIEPRLRFAQGQVAAATAGNSGSTFGATVDPFLTRLGRMVAGAGASRKLRETLARAGFYNEAAATVYLGLKMLMLTIALVVSAVFILFSSFSPLLTMTFVISTSGLLFFVPNIVLEMLWRRRCSEIRTYMPDAVDLLEVCVSSGMGLDMAWNAVTDEIRCVCGVLADEMALTNLEMQLGAARSVAMRRMAARTGSDELSSLVALLVQSDRFGTSISDTLRNFAGAMRESRSQRAEEAAERMAVKLLFPMVLFIFPVMLIATVGPAALAIADMIMNN